MPPIRTPERRHLKSAAEAVIRRGMEGELIVLYDSRCPFCVGWVKFLLDRDGYDRLSFAGLDSSWVHDFLEQRGLPHPGMKSLAVWDGERLRRESDAVLRITAALPGVWSLIRHLDRLPANLRDRVYRFIADHRYRIFGRYERCWVPKASDRRKFLDLEENGGVA